MPHVRVDSRRLLLNRRGEGALSGSDQDRLLLGTASETELDLLRVCSSVNCCSCIQACGPIERSKSVVLVILGFNSTCRCRTCFSFYC